jgi:hypothetical protein
LWWGVFAGKSLADFSMMRLSDAFRIALPNLQDRLQQKLNAVLPVTQAHVPNLDNVAVFDDEATARRLAQRYIWITMVNEYSFIF